METGEFLSIFAILVFFTVSFIIYLLYSDFEIDITNKNKEKNE